MAYKKGFIKRYLDEADTVSPSKQPRLVGSGYELRSSAAPAQPEAAAAADNQNLEITTTTFEVTRRKGRKEATLDRVTPNGDTSDYGIFLNDLQAVVQPILESEVMKQKGVKYHLIADITFRNSKEPGDNQEWNIVSKATRLLPTDNISEELNVTCSDLSRKIGEYVQRGSGWIVDHLNFIDLYINRYRPLRGNSYMPTIGY